MLQRMVSFSLFAGQKIPHAEYRRFFLLVTLDLFSEYTEKEKAGRVGKPLGTMRAKPGFAAIQEKILEAAGKLALEMKMDKAAEALEEVMVREQARLALAGRPSDRPEAVASFLDRRSAKKGRDPEVGKGLYLPEGFIEAIRLGFQLSRGQLDDGVSAERLNTPRMIGPSSA